MNVPVLALHEQYAGIKQEFFEKLDQIFDSGHFILGPDVAALESELADYLNVSHAIGVSSGTEALWLALKALGIGAGDRVLTSPFTFFATVGAIINTGAEPVFADIEPTTFNLDPEKAEDALRRDPAIRTIIPVHLYGQMADMDPFSTLSTQYGVKILEDAAQSIGAKYKGKMSGSLGHLGCFSFYPTKNLGALGEAGLVTTQESSLAESVRKLSVHGASPQTKYLHDSIGSNCRMDTTQAAFLRVALRHLSQWLSEREKRALYYENELAPLKEWLEIPHRSSNGNHTFHQYTLRVKHGGQKHLQNYLAKKGVGTAIYYPVPCHLQTALRNLHFSKGQFPETERAAQEVLSLPIYPTLSREKQDWVIQAIREWTQW